MKTKDITLGIILIILTGVMLFFHYQRSNCEGDYRYLSDNLGSDQYYNSGDQVLCIMGETTGLSSLLKEGIVNKKTNGLLFVLTGGTGEWIPIVECEKVDTFTYNQ